MKNIASWSGLAALALSLVGCSAVMEADLDQVAREYMSSEPATQAVKDAVASVQSSAAKHAVKLAEEKPTGNLMISPYSYQQCLGMIRLGSSGATNRELADWLGLPLDSGKSASALRSNRVSLDPLVRAGVISTANGVWVSRSSDINAAYLNQVKDLFAASVRSSGFPDPALQEINQFAKEQTKGRIEKILEELHPLSRMVLVNAIHFKDKWVEPFKKEQTEEGDFHAPDGVKRVSLMNGGMGFDGARQEGFTFVTTRFKTGLRVAFALPPSKEMPVEASLAPLMKIIQKGFSLEVAHVALPKFKSEFKWDMAPTMKQMGVQRAFDPSAAEFEGMSKERLHISQIVQKTFVQFDEEGVEAAAVTAGEMAAMAAPAKEEPVTFIADRPYAYVIYDKDGMPLFLGIVRDPTKG